MAVYTKENKPKTTQSGVVPPKMKNRYSLRIKEAERKESASGNPMIVWGVEVVSPEKVELYGNDYIVSGLEFNYYLMLNPERIGDVIDLYDRLGLGPVDTDQKDLSGHVGIVFDAILDSRERVANRKVGNEYVPITDADGKPISQGWEVVANVRDILFPSKTPVGGGIADGPKF